MYFPLYEERLIPSIKYRAANTKYTNGWSGCPERYRFGQCAKTGLQPSVQVHPIPIYPRCTINNIPILDTIHLEINQQPIGKPEQIDFEIDNL